MKETVPQSTYRLQFNYLFTFKQASELVDYWYDLGITHIYASPITKARSKSLYGYDVVDHTQINPEIGTEQEFVHLAKLLKEKGMGLILDIVPNHMCISAEENLWWKDVLENGPNSIYAHYFDISWNPPKLELKNKIFLPILTQQLGQVIENHELKICYEKGAFYLDYNGTHLPLNPNSWSTILKFVDSDRLQSLDDFDPDLLEFQSILTALNHLPPNSDTDLEKCREHNREKEVIKKRLNLLLNHRVFFKELIQTALLKLNGKKGDSESFNKLEQILKEQVYRLSYWRLSNDLINYRRFFDIDDLACLHIENEEVFEATHSLIMRLVDEGWISGLRIDHIDGLYEPEEYLKRLKGQGKASQQLYLIVEKILVRQEELNSNWPVHGTTGYDYLNVLNNLFVDARSQLQMQSIYENFIGYSNQLNKIVCECKKLILLVSMASELNITTRRLEIISEQHRSSYDFPYESLRAALRDVIASFSVYRSYIKIGDQQVSKNDQKVIFKAIEHAKKLNPASDHLVFDFIKSVLLLDNPSGLTKEQLQQRQEFVLHFQQLTGPVMAKGFEDTALYRSYSLSSLNDVGMDPSKFGIGLEDFHLENIERQEQWPHSLLATSTHDTKRSEDVRARINTLSEIPKQWQKVLQTWFSLNKAKKDNIDSHVVPSANEEYLLYQTLIGSWPFSFDSEDEKKTYLKRIQDYMSKALKEAKVHTSWLNPNEDYQAAVNHFIKKILDEEQENSFLIDFQNFIRPLQMAGMWNSLSQLVLKMTAPGIPDFYQGSELFELTLVDPDNRRPICFDTRQQKLKQIQEKAKSNFAELLNSLKNNLETGELKLFLIWQLLNFRKQNLSLFSEGDYSSLEIKEEDANHLIAFKRVKDNAQIIVITTRFFMSLLQKDENLDPQKIWGNTVLHLPLQGNWKDVLTHKEYQFENSEISIKELFEYFPFVVLQAVQT